MGIDLTDLVCPHSFWVDGVWYDAKLTCDVMEMEGADVLQMVRINKGLWKACQGKRPIDLPDPFSHGERSLMFDVWCRKFGVQGGPTSKATIVSNVEPNWPSAIVQQPAEDEEGVKQPPKKKKKVVIDIIEPKLTVTIDLTDDSKPGVEIIDLSTETVIPLINLTDDVEPEDDDATVNTMDVDRYATQPFACMEEMMCVYKDIMEEERK